MKRKFISASIMLMLLQCYYLGKTQDVGFSQFYDQPLLRNPALAGVFTGDVRVTAAFRNQWQSVTIPYRTYALNAELKMPVLTNYNLTLGLQVIRDVAGTAQFSTTQILPAANFNFPLSDDRPAYLSFAVMGGLMQQRFDPAKLIMNDQFIAGSNGSLSVLPASRQVFNKTDVNYLDLSAGISYSSTFDNDVQYFVGGGLFHLTKPNVGFYDGNIIIRNRKLGLNAGLSAPTSETDRFIAYADYFKQFASAFKPAGKGVLQYGFMFSRDLFVEDDMQKTITLGLLHRLNDAVIPVVKLQLSKFIIGISYDVNVSKLVSASTYRGGFELTLSYRDILNIHNSELRQVDCWGPQFKN
ncbi:PorP/SprF family type IX secretion system membrane protein [Longitalea arenae]|uniref:PorP/SprF family type IX secretion system membrane protein n=1 Tax=Longitalea arenae TaxID=2812558 RepID=UPI001967378C|nr:PorP/SprF family type IX secretion system membrane protein [Longitalea arenae]